MTIRPEDALEYHSKSPAGKIAVVATKPCRTQRDLSLAYSPGVAVPCLAIEKDPSLAYAYTAKGNLVGVVSNGTAVLGLGNIGAQAGKPVIVATQMLESMIKNPLPTRAEVSDVANAVLDGTDAIMLSGESATGKYPLKAVQFMTKIAKQMEQEEVVEQEAREGIFKNNKSITQVISFIAQDLAEDSAAAKLIVCATTSGFTARNISRFRAGVPVVAVTPSPLTLNQLVLSWGVEPQLIRFTDSFNVLLKNIKKLVLQKRLVKKGDTVVVVAGHPFGYKGQSNLIKVEVI